MPARQLSCVMSEPPWTPNKLLLLVSLVLALGLAGAVGTDHPSNDTHPYNSGGSDVHSDLARNETDVPYLNLGTDHPSNDTHPYNSGGSDVHSDLARNETDVPFLNLGTDHPSNDTHPYNSGGSDVHSDLARNETDVPFLNLGTVHPLNDTHPYNSGGLDVHLDLAGNETDVPFLNLGTDHPSNDTHPYNSGGSDVHSDLARNETDVPFLNLGTDHPSNDTHPYNSGGSDVHSDLARNETDVPFLNLGTVHPLNDTHPYNSGGSDAHLDLGGNETDVPFLNLGTDHPSNDTHPYNSGGSDVHSDLARNETDMPFLNLGTNHPSNDTHPYNSGGSDVHSDLARNETDVPFLNLGTVHPLNDTHPYNSGGSDVHLDLAGNETDVPFLNLGTVHPLNDTHPYNSGSLDVHLDLARNETYFPVPNYPDHVCTVPYCTLKSSQCASQESYTCAPPEEDCGLYTNTRIICYGYNKGCIQVFIDREYHPERLDSCVTLEVPADRVAMVSFAGNVSCRNRKVVLTQHMNAACQGEGERLCGENAKPAVHDLPAISFRLRVRASWEIRPVYGFSILYSFHESTAMPEKLRNGLWDCSVPYFSQFMDHFVCNPGNLCSDFRYIDRCSRMDINICGFPKYWKPYSPGPGQCYYVFHDTGDSTWSDAVNHCMHLGSRVLTAKTPAFLEMTANDTYRLIFAGKMKKFVPDMYQNTWVWEDNTLAMYSDLAAYITHMAWFRKKWSKQCIVVRYDQKYLDHHNCDEPVYGASYACDLSGPALKDVNFLLPALIIEPAEEPFTIDGLMQMARCDDNHMVHAFQVCDATTGCLRTSTEAGRSCADSKFSSPMPFFTCNSECQEGIPYTKVCDFREDCSDGSDENFCQRRRCSVLDEFTCENKQCIRYKEHCDRVSNCYDGSDEKGCVYPYSRIRQTLDNIQPPAVVNWMSTRWQIRRLEDPDFSCSTTHFHCPGYKVCLPVYLLCNGINDCPDKQDETGCDHFRCPGFYRCRSSRICLHRDHLCDGVVQCPHHDDELMCDDGPCPAACVCYGYAFTCTGEFDVIRYRDLRYLDASGSGMTLAAVSFSNALLIHLSLRHCGITSVGEVILPNLQRLDLSHNLVKFIAAWELNQLGNLRYLSLAYNPVSLRLDFLSDANHEFPLVRGLNFAGLNIPLLNETFALTFPNTEELNLSDSSLKLLPKSGFRSFKHLRVLDIRKCQLQTVFSDLFDGLVELEAIHAEDFKICCPSALPAGFNPKDCNAPIDEVSSCKALLRSEVYRVFLVLYALFSLLGNLGSFVYRVIVVKSDVAMGFDVFVTHLSVADFLMGVYLAIIGVADRIFYGDYVWHANEWKHSTPCLIAGFLSFVSSEVSVFLVCFITLERLLVIRFPMKNLRFSRRTAHIICVALWIVGVTLSAVPLFPSLKHWEFYSQYGICIPLPVTRKTFPGMDYAFGVMIGLNFVVFVFIAVGQGLIYVSFRSNTMTGQNRAKSKDVTITSRLLAVVLTDFLCWFPIGLLGILARSDVSIPGEVNVGMAIFVLPFNSALNPFLYTVIVVLERRRKT